MDRETANKLYDVLLARAGLRGKDPSKWTKDEEALFWHHFRKMPGEYRQYARWDWARKSATNIESAKDLGMDVETFIRIGHAGGSRVMDHEGVPQSPLAEPNPGTPGNTYGIETTDMYVTPS